MTPVPADDPRLTAHLDAVARALGDDANAATVLAHLRSHIAEALASHAASPDPVATVLAELDPPEAYRPSATATNARGRLGRWALLLCLAAPLIGVLSGAVVADARLGWLVFTAIDLAAAAAGAIAWRQPWGRVAVGCAVGIYAVVLVLAALFPQR